jgi:hypothetical protein
MDIYVVEDGWDSEGSQIIGATTSLELAKERANRGLPKSHTLESWKDCEEGQWMARVVGDTGTFSGRYREINKTELETAS